MDGAASEAVRGIKVEKDSDLNQIWEALSRRFGFVDEPARAMRRFDVRKQQESESLAVFEQGLRVLYREAWPKTDIRSSEADSLLRRKFVDGIADVELQKYLRLHAASDDFAATVSKARHFVDASELSRIHKKPAIRATSPSVNYQTIFDGVRDALANVLHDQGRTAEVNVVQEPNLNANDGSRNRIATSRKDHGPPAIYPLEIPAVLHLLVVRFDFKTITIVEQKSRFQPRNVWNVALVSSDGQNFN